MRVLFVSSGRQGDVGYVVRNQGESLRRYGVEIDYLTIKPSFCGYAEAILHIRRKFRTGSYDLVHAHYSLSGFSASLAGRFPLVVSLMGSDAHHHLVVRWLIRLLSSLHWMATIVKTEEMKQDLRLSKAYVIPNGVDTERFVPIDREIARKRLGITTDNRIILFISAGNRPEKRLDLAKEAVESLHESSVSILHLHDKENAEIPQYLGAADLLLLTSLREGSVNVIKEAMACNCPVVATDVGDVSWVIRGVEGCYLSDHNVDSIAENIRKALRFESRTTGRERIFELGLDSSTVAAKISSLYASVQQTNIR
jgi:glycosyltransferase involved in cell wall biosynthesis